ncbi:META domain-containing protein [Agreia sp.]|uniref:META domain-containing protein n=1 Tax=Agreia sp. TaxID=1872416 RepID=UPI0035BBB3C8
MTVRIQIQAALTVAAVAVLLSACATVGPASTPVPTSTVQPGALVGTWTVDETFDSPEQPYISFVQDNTWSASDGCNRVRGSWQLNADGSLITTVGPMTKIGCDGAPLPTTVAQSTSVSVDGDALALVGANGPTKLVRASDPAVGPRGRPVGYWAERRTSTSPFLSLAADGTFSGSDGCNTLVGSWTYTDDEQVVFGQIASTLMACEGVDTWLNQAATGRVQANIMTVDSADGTVIGQLEGF